MGTASRPEGCIPSDDAIPVGLCGSPDSKPPAAATGIPMTASLFLRLLGLMTSIGFGYLVFDYNAPDEEATHAVTGSVRVAGRPLPNGTIRFISTASSVPRGAGAFITDGAYAIDKANGPRAGKYLVQISSIGQEDQLRALREGGNAGIPEEAVPVRFNSESRIFVEVAADGSVLGFDFDLK
jgi:hypothetical protein